MEDVVYVVDDKLGGIASLNANLIQYRVGPVSQSVVLLRDLEGDFTPTKESLGADKEIRFEYSKWDNVYSVFRRLSTAIPAGPGPLVSNNALELALYSVHAPTRTIFQIVHDEYNLGLSKAYEPIIDVMIAHSNFYYEKLKQEFPTRADRIFHLPYGIRLSSAMRKSAKGPLRLVFLGRLHQAKGVHDLPQIDRLLLENGGRVTWTIIGDGPERALLQKNWPPSDRVRYVNPTTNKEVLELCTKGDVFVLPTRFEGFPVALLEGMSAGLVPVVSDLPSGIPEVVLDGVGYRLPVCDCDAFAKAILALDCNRVTLEEMSHAALEQAQRFDIRDRALAYHRLFSEWEKFQRPWSGPLAIKQGSRLDRPWLPNVVTRSLRSLASFAQRSSSAV